MSNFKIEEMDQYLFDSYPNLVRKQQKLVFLNEKLHWREEIDKILFRIPIAETIVTNLKVRLYTLN